MRSTAKFEKMNIAEKKVMVKKKEVSIAEKVKVNTPRRRKNKK